MKQKSMLTTILILLGLFFIGSLVLSLVGSLLWLTVKIMIPLAIAVWLVRVITKTSNHYKKSH